MRHLIMRLEKRLVRGHEFISNVVYYIREGHRIRAAIEMARLTLP